MSATETVSEKRRASLAKAREAKRAKAAGKPKAPEVFDDDPLAGLTQTECPIDCTADKCSITHAPICGHPCKGALQPIFKARPDCVERYNKARKKLLHEKVDRRK